MDPVDGESMSAVGDFPPRVRNFKRQVETARQEITDCALELDRRRREALDFRLQVRRHPAAAAGIAVGLVAGVAGAAFLAVRSVRRRVKKRTVSGRLGESARTSGLDPAAISRKAWGAQKSFARLPVFAAAARLLSGRALSALGPAIATFAARRVAAALSSSPSFRRR